MILSAEEVLLLLLDLEESALLPRLIEVAPGILFVSRGRVCRLLLDTFFISLVPVVCRPCFGGLLLLLLVVLAVFFLVREKACELRLVFGIGMLLLEDSLRLVRGLQLLDFHLQSGYL